MVHVRTGNESSGTNGAIERFFGSVKHEDVYLKTPQPSNRSDPDLRRILTRDTLNGARSCAERFVAVLPP